MYNLNKNVIRPPNTYLIILWKICSESLIQLFYLDFTYDRDYNYDWVMGVSDSHNMTNNRSLATPIARIPISFSLTQMPKTRPRSTKKAIWSSDTLAKADSLMKQGLSMRQAVKFINIPFSSLQRRVKNQTFSDTRLGRHPVFTAELEHFLWLYCYTNQKNCLQICRGPRIKTQVWPKFKNGWTWLVGGLFEKK